MRCGLAIWANVAHRCPASRALEPECVGGQFGVPIKVLQPPHLGPRRIDAQGDDRQQQIDDPDAEIFGATTGETNCSGARAEEAFEFN